LRLLAAVRCGEDANPGELLLLASRAWGEDVLGRLRGAFTAVIADGSKLSCVRDQLGLRPLFYRATSDGFIAGTEAKQVAVGAGITREPDLDAVEDLFFGRIEAETTALRGVSRFPRATVADIDPTGQCSFRRYWDDPRSLATRRDFIWRSKGEAGERAPRFHSERSCCSGRRRDRRSWCAFRGLMRCRTFGS